MSNEYEENEEYEDNEGYIPLTSNYAEENIKGPDEEEYVLASPEEAVENVSYGKNTSLNKDNRRKIYFADKPYIIQGNKNLNVKDIAGISMKGYFDTSRGGDADEALYLNLKFHKPTLLNKRKYVWYENVVFRTSESDERDGDDKIFTLYEEVLRDYNGPNGPFKCIKGGGNRRKTKKYKRKNTKNKTKKSRSRNNMFLNRTNG